MKAKLLLAVNADRASAPLISRAASRTHHRVVPVATSREAFCRLQRGVEAPAALVIDLGPGVQGIEVLEALEPSPAAPPVIVLTETKEPWLRGLAAVHGAACLEKPFTAGELAAAIEEVSAPAWRREAYTCDAWGHPHRCSHELFPCPGCHRRPQPHATAEECASV